MKHSAWKKFFFINLKNLTILNGSKKISSYKKTKSFTDREAFSSLGF